MADELLRRNLDRVFDPGPDFPSRLLLSRTVARIRSEAGPAPRRRSGIEHRLPRFTIRAAAGVAMLALVMAAGAVLLSLHRPGTQAPGTAYRPVLVYTTWTPDPQVTGGPEPGYRPALTGLTSADVASAKVGMDASGNVWIVTLTFTPLGARRFADLTRANVAACPGDAAITASANCPQRHLTIWVDLTQTDIDHWREAAYVAQVTRALDLQCLARKPSTTVCGKFLTDPITRDEIDGGQAQITGAFSEQDAKTLADAINKRTS